MSVAPEDYKSAEQFIEENIPFEWIGTTKKYKFDSDNVEELIRIASKYHVSHALKQAYYKVSTRDIKGSIENAYPDENIR